MPKNDDTTNTNAGIIELYEMGIEFLEKAAKDGISSELGEANKKPEKEELIFRLREIYTIGTVITNTAKTLIEIPYLYLSDETKLSKDTKAKLEEYDLSTLNTVYDMWLQYTIKLLRLYETNEYSLYSKENLLGRFTDDELYKINKTHSSKLDAEKIFTELGTRQKALREIIVDLEGNTKTVMSDDEILQKYKELGQINARLDLSETYPVVILTDSSEARTLNSWVSKDSDPFKIIGWCINNSPNKFVLNSRVKRELSLKYGINETLRKSVFSPSGALNPFITNDDTGKKIRVKLEAKLSEDQLEKIKAVSS